MERYPILVGECRFDSVPFSNEWRLTASSGPVAVIRRHPQRHASAMTLASGTRIDIEPDGWGEVVAREGETEHYRIARRSWLGRRFSISGTGFACDLTSDRLPRRWTMRIGGEPIGRLVGSLVSYNRLAATADVSIPAVALSLAWHVLARPWEAAATPGVLRPAAAARSAWQRTDV